MYSSEEEPSTYLHISNDVLCLSLRDSHDEMVMDNLWDLHKLGKATKVHEDDSGLRVSC